MKTKRVIGVLLAIIMLMSHMMSFMLTANAEEESHYLDVFYLTPPQIVNDMIGEDSTSYLEVTYYTTAGAMRSSRMVNVGNGIYGAVVKQNVTNLELRLKTADDSELWFNAISPSEDSIYNMACYYEEQPDAVWEVYGIQINSPTVPGVLYFTPSSTWASAGTRFSVCFISAEGGRTYEELVPIGDGSFAVCDMECAKYQFYILREDATEPNQTTAYTSPQLIRTGEDNNHCVLVESNNSSGVYGQWKKRESIENPSDIVNISFNSNGGTGTMRDRTCPINSDYVLPYCIYTPPLGMAFKAWEVHGIEYQPGESVYMNLNEVVINAVWKDAISVTYTANGGGGDDITIYLSEAQTITLPENTFTAPDMKSFKAWEVNGTEYPVGKQVPISQNTVIKAVWCDGYTITYDPNGGNGTNVSRVFNPSQTITLDQNKFSHPQNYSFRGWEINGELYLPGDSYVIESNVVAYAKWNKTFTVEYIFVSPASNERKFTDNVSEGEIYTVKSPYELEGITFNDRYEISGWRNGDVLYEGGQEISLTESITLTLDYKYKLYRTFYYDNNYAEEKQYTVYMDEEFIIPECTFTPPEGYMFEYWQPSTDTSKKYYPGDKYEPNTAYSDGVFFAVWIEATELGSLDKNIKDGILAGAEYTLPGKTKKLSDGSFADVEWSVKEKGMTDASISNTNILTAQKGGSIIISARVSGGMEDGSDFYKEYEVSVSADYQIRTADDLFDFAEKVNNGYLYINAILMNDIDLENRPWTPIGTTGEENNNFRGHFDGRNYTITGLNLEGDRNGLGFFGEVRLGTVENFTIYGDVKLNNKFSYVGGVIGSAPGVNNADAPEHNGAIIRNITSYVNVTLGEDSHGSNHIGGFIGYVNHETLIENCAWYGTLNLGSYRAQDGVGGLVGKAYNNSAVVIRNCAAYGTIETSYKSGAYNNFDTIYIGGILSYSANGATTTIENNLWAGKIINGTDLGDKAHISAFGTLNGKESVKNCYALNSVPYVSTENKNADSITTVTVEQLKSGEVAYKLGKAFGQTINTDLNPVLSGAKVYKYTDSYSNELKFGFADYTSDGASVNIPKEGTYSLIFADYEGGVLNGIDVVTVTVTADKVGEITQASEKDVNIGTGDKIMLQQNMTNFVPLCDALILE